MLFEQLHTHAHTHTCMHDYPSTDIVCCVLAPPSVDRLEHCTHCWLMYTISLQTEAEPVTQRFPSSRQQSKSQMEKTASTASIASTKLEEVSPVFTRKEMPATPTEHGSPKPLHHPVSASPPTPKSSFQKFLMKKASQGNVPSELAVAKTPSTTDNSSPKVSRPTTGSTGSAVISDFKKPGPSKELPPSIFNLLAKNAPKTGTRNKPSKHPYGNVGNSNDFIANLAMKYGKQGGVAAHTQDSPSMKHHTKQPAVPAVANTTPSITDDCKLPYSYR